MRETERRKLKYPGLGGANSSMSSSSIVSSASLRSCSVRRSKYECVEPCFVALASGCREDNLAARGQNNDGFPVESRRVSVVIRNHANSLNGHRLCFHHVLARVGGVTLAPVQSSV